MKKKKEYTFKYITDVTYTGIFSIPANIVKLSGFQPLEKITVRVSKNIIYIRRASKTNYGFSYYTYVLNNGSIFLKNEDWCGVTSLNIVVKNNRNICIKRNKSI